MEDFSELVERARAAVCEDGTHDAPLSAIATRCKLNILPDKRLFAGIVSIVQLPVSLEDVNHKFKPELPMWPSRSVHFWQTRAVEGPSNSVPEIFCS